MLLDTSPQALGLAQGVAAKGLGQDALVEALRNRRLSQSNRLLSNLGELGPAISPTEMEADTAARKAAAGPLFQQALDDAGPVDIGPVQKQLADALRYAKGTDAARLNQANDLLTLNAPKPVAPAPAANDLPFESPLEASPAYSSAAPTKPNAQSLVNFLQANGGVQDPGGDLVPRVIQTGGRAS